MPPAGGKVSGVAGVQLTLARAVNDPAAINNLDPQNCYNVRYQRASKSYESWYTLPPGVSPPGPNIIGGLSGDPLKNEINVYGVLMAFTDAGEVIDRNGNVVGQLVCFLTNECGGF